MSGSASGRTPGRWPLAGGTETTGLTYEVKINDQLTCGFLFLLLDTK